MDLQQQFAAEVAAFLETSGMKPTAFGREALGDPSFVPTLEKGRAPNLRTIDRARAFMGQYTASKAA